jgi:hypothetical protein
MKLAFIAGTLAGLALLTASCGGSKKPAEEAENATDEGDEAGAPAADMPPADSTLSPPTSSAKVGGGDEKPASPCAGFDVDLAKVLAQASCVIPNAGPSDKARDTKGILDVKVSLNAVKVAPGGHVDVTVTFANKSKGDLPLDFVVDPEPRFEIQVFDKNGRQVDAPAGPEPSLPSDVANATVPDKQTARATIVVAGSGRVTIPWDAVKKKWAPKDKAKGAIPGRGYPTVPGGPLPKGQYTLKVVTPLTGIFEGVDHEVSQPRIPINVSP